MQTLRSMHRASYRVPSTFSVQSEEFAVHVLVLTGALGVKLLSFIFECLTVNATSLYPLGNMLKLERFPKDSFGEISEWSVTLVLM